MDPQLREKLRRRQQANNEDSTPLSPGDSKGNIQQTPAPTPPSTGKLKISPFLNKKSPPKVDVVEDAAKIRESQLAYEKKKKERDEKERLIREEEEKQKKLRAIEMEKKRKQEIKEARAEKEKELRLEYKEKLESELAEEIERVRIEKERRAERARIAEEKRKKAERARHLQTIKEEQEQMDLQVRRINMKQAGMTKEEIDLILERERMDKEAKEREEENQRKMAEAEEKNQRIMAEAAAMKEKLSSGKKNKKKASTDDAPPKSRLLAAVKQAEAAKEGPSPRSKLLDKVNKANAKKKKSRRSTTGLEVPKPSSRSPRKGVGNNEPKTSATERRRSTISVADHRKEVVDDNSIPTVIGPDEGDGPVPTYEQWRAANLDLDTSITESSTGLSADC